MALVLQGLAVPAGIGSDGHCVAGYFTHLKDPFPSASVLQLRGQMWPSAVRDLNIDSLYITNSSTLLPQTAPGY